MRRVFLCISILFFLSAPLYAFRIPAYNTDYDVQKNGTIIVTETIAVDFTGESRHGIHRDIPISGIDRYHNHVRLRLKIISVTDNLGNEIKYRKTNQANGIVEIKVGDPNVYVTGSKVYVIKYRLMRAIRYYTDHDELYGNAVGGDWDVPIENASCTVHLPSAVPKEKLMVASYTGLYGSAATDAYIKINNRIVQFVMTRPLNPQEFLTVVVGWPKGITAKPSLISEAIWFITDNSFCFLPILLILVLIWMWQRYGRDPDSGAPVTVAYEPPDGLSPAELGTLIDERVDMKDISATIIDLAVRGFITIKPEVEKVMLIKKTDYELKLIPPIDSISKNPDLSEFESDLLRNIFGGQQFQWVSQLEGKFYASLGILKDDLYDSLVQKGYFAARPDRVRKGYQYAGWAVMVLAGLIVGIFRESLDVSSPLSAGWPISIGICGLILLIASKYMPRKTLKGSKALKLARGFEEYLMRAEKQEIVYQERQGYFEKFLPYAMVFGIARQWAKAFDGLQMEPPSWYEGDYLTYRPSLLVYDLDTAVTNLSYAMSTPPPSSRSSSRGGFFSGGSGFGGGFSGGGFGGGGGGSW